MERSPEYGINGEKRRVSQSFVDLPLEYREGDDPPDRGAIVVNASDEELLMESLKDMAIGTKLNIAIMFAKGFELTDVKAAAEVVWKELHWKEDWEGYQYRLNITQWLEEDHWKLKLLLNGQSN